MDKPSRPKNPWLAPLGWGVGALAVVVTSLLAMRQGGAQVAERETLRAAAAVEPTKAEDRR